MGCRDAFAEHKHRRLLAVTKRLKGSREQLKAGGTELTSTLKGEV